MFQTTLLEHYFKIYTLTMAFLRDQKVTEMQQVEKLLIFLASPSDVPTERRYVEEIIADLNRTVASARDIVLQVVRWENDAFPGYGMDAQALINAQIAEMAKYTLFIGIMWNRLGSPTPRAISGTVEEFERAVEAHIQNGRPEIWFYFRESASKLDTEEQLEQRKKVLAFKAQVQANGLPWTYKNPSDFRNKFRNQMTLWLNARTQMMPAPRRTDLRQIFLGWYLSHIEFKLHLKDKVVYTDVLKELYGLKVMVRAIIEELALPRAVVQMIEEFLELNDVEPEPTQIRDMVAHAIHPHRGIAAGLALVLGYNLASVELFAGLASRSGEVTANFANPIAGMLSEVERDAATFGFNLSHIRELREKILDEPTEANFIYVQDSLKELAEEWATLIEQ